MDYRNSDRNEDPNPLKTFFSVLVTLYFLGCGVLVGVALIYILFASHKR